MGWAGCAAESSTPGLAVRGTRTTRVTYLYDGMRVIQERDRRQPDHELHAGYWT